MLYKNILNGAYNRTTKYVKKQSNRIKTSKIINKKSAF